MSVLIKGMKMPKNCSECQLEYDQMRCSVVGFNWYGQDYIDIGFDPNFNKLPECPLIEIPNKHGDLIDRDACINYCRDSDQRSWEALAYAEPVIEAED